MNNVVPIIKQEAALHLLDSIQKTPQITQRKLSQKLNISLGKINFIIKELSKKGYVKAKRAAGSEHKLSYVYILTPEGAKQKIELTKGFLKKKIKEYDQLKNDIELLKERMAEN